MINYQVLIILSGHPTPEIEIAYGEQLDELASIHRIERYKFESDYELRIRIIREIRAGDDRLDALRYATGPYTKAHSEADKIQAMKTLMDSGMITSDDGRKILGLKDPTSSDDAVRVDAISTGLNWISVKEGDAFSIGGISYIITPKGPLMYYPADTGWKYPEDYDYTESTDMIKLLKEI